MTFCSPATLNGRSPLVDYHIVVCYPVPYRGFRMVREVTRWGTAKHTRERRCLIHPPTFRPQDWLRFVQLRPFERNWRRAGMDDDDLRALEMIILTNPKSSPVVRGTGRLRKLRFSRRTESRGKSGAWRVCYVHFEEFGIILLVSVYGKGDKSDLTAAEAHEVKAVIDDIERYLNSNERGRAP